MAFAKHDLGQCAEGSVAEVTAAHPANVYLLDARNFDSYLHGRRFRAIAARAEPDVPFGLIVPATGRWFLVIDRGGARGAIRASARVLDPAPIDPEVPVVQSAVTARELLGGR
jgi:Domain of unknown function (DUF1883)